jgi:hypothetical protein
MNLEKICLRVGKVTFNRERNKTARTFVITLTVGARKTLAALDVSRHACWRKE